MERRTDKKVVLGICLVLAICTAGVYWQVSRYEFINLDDLGYVLDNPHVQYGFSVDNIKWAFAFNGYASNWHPVTWLSHMLDCELFGADAGAHHLVNLFFHIANTLLLFFVLKQMTNALWRSAFVAALFALHPLHVESVAWISERKDVLSTFFGLLTVWVYVGYVKQPKISIYLLMVVFFALGLIAKPMLVTLPFVLLLLDYWPLERFGKQSVYYLVLEKVPLFVMSAASSVITVFVQKIITVGQLGLNVRIANAFISYVKYIGKMIYPSRLAVFYPHPDAKLSMVHGLGAALLLLGITAAVIYLGRRYKYLAVGWLWYLGTLVPVIGLVQVGGLAMADRYAYVPLTGLFIIIAWGAGDAAAKWRYRKSILGVSAMIVISTMAVCTWFQAGYWRNSVSLFQHALDITEDNYLAHKCLADALRENEDFERAIEEYQKVLQIDKNYVSAYIGLGAVLNDIGRADEAMTIYEKALKLEPERVETINTLAWYFATHNDDKVRNPGRAVKLAQRACELTNYNSPEVLDTLAAAYAAAGDFGKAVEITEKAMGLCQSPKRKSLRKEIESRLVLYKAGKAYIEN